MSQLLALPRNHHEFQSSAFVSYPPGLVMARIPRNQGNTDSTRKRKMDNFERRLTQAENRLTQYSDRLDHVELRTEMDQSYKFLRVEASQGLAEMSERIEKGEVAKGDIRDLTGQTVTREGTPT